jgi:hypothetical protein
MLYYMHIDIVENPESTQSGSEIRFLTCSRKNN